MEGLTLAKQTCADFVSLIYKYDIICLIETWTTKTSQIEITGYKTLVHSYRKFVNKRAKRASGGLIIYVKNSIYKGVKLVKNEIDCIIWFKLEKEFFNLEEDIYIGAAYIVPENSAVHAVYDVDFFLKLEEDISFFANKGKVLLMGDLNSRTGTKNDFINTSQDRTDSYLFSNETPSTRVSMDRTVNRFGDMLLDLCKASGMCIVNGRFIGDENNGSYTCMTANGESVVDYLLTSFSNFKMISDFKVHAFNEHSNHTPLSFSIRANCHEVREATQNWK
ncbi:MAG: endonuclease/exonuclease/phosphatase family protein, partial [Candidatus Thiodiazotropha sp.]